MHQAVNIDDSRSVLGNLVLKLAFIKKAIQVLFALADDISLETLALSCCYRGTC